MPRNNLPSLAKQFRDLKSDYKADYAAASPSRFRRQRSGLFGAADSHYASDAQFVRMREYVRDMDRNDCMIGATVDNAVRQHMQGGFRVDPMTGDRPTDRLLWERWQDWSTDPEQCDVAGELEFADLEELVLRAQIVDGDICALPLVTGQLQLMEADRLRTPTNSRRNIVHGVEMDGLRKRHRYYFTKEQIDPYQRVQRVSDTTPIAARDEDGNKQVFHVFHADRVTQTRGITAFHAIFDIAGMWDDVNFALLVKQQMSACFGAFLKRTGDYAIGDTQLGERSTETLEDGSSATLEGLSPGLFIRGRRGEELQTYSPNIPSSETMQHMRMLLQIIGVNIGMPLVLILLDPSESSYSSWRGAMDSARLGFRSNQKQLVRRFHRPVYHWKLREWIETDPQIRAASQELGPKIFEHRWQTPSWGYIEPMKDAEADAFRIENILASPRQVAAERGRDFDDIVDELVTDNGRAIFKAIRMAERISKKTGEPVNWRDVLNRQLPANSALLLAKGPEEAVRPGDEPTRDDDDDTTREDTREDPQR